MTQTYSYRLYYTGLEGDMNPKQYHCDNKAKAGDVIQLETGYWHYVIEVKQVKRPPYEQLRLGKSGQDREDALYEALDQGYLTESDMPHA
jgi:hypothetical protein